MNNHHHINKLQITIAIAIATIVNANHIDMKLNPLTISNYLKNNINSKIKNNNKNNQINTTTVLLNAINYNVYHMLSIDIIDKSINNIMNICQVLPSLYDLICIEFIHSILQNMNMK